MSEGKRIDKVDRLVANRVRCRRIMLGMNQSELGRALGVSVQQLQKYEKGINRISAGRLFALSKILKVSIEYFYKDHPEINAVVLEENLNKKEIRCLIREFYKIKEIKKRKKLIKFMRVMAVVN